MNRHALIKKFAIFLFILAATGCGGGGGGGSSSSGGPDVVPGGSDFPAISWYSAAQPLIQRYCVSCHTEGGTAPFPLETYEQVYGKRSAIAFALESDVEVPALAGAEQGLLAACAGVNELATARRDARRLGLRRSAELARGVPDCERAAQAAAAALRAGSD